MLSRLLSKYCIPTEDEEFELLGLLPNDISLRGSETALVAALVETDISPQQLDPPPQNDIAAVLTTLFAAVRNAEADWAIFTMDWNGKRIVAVCQQMHVSVCSVSLDDLLQKVGSYDSLEREAYGALYKLCENNFITHESTLDLVLRLRGGIITRYVCQKGNNFLRRRLFSRPQSGHGELKTHEDGLPDLQNQIVNQAGRGSVPEKLSRFSRLESERYKGSISSDCNSVCVGGVWFKRTIYKALDDGGVGIYTRDITADTVQEVSTSAEVGSDLQSCCLPAFTMGITCLWKPRPRETQSQRVCAVTLLEVIERYERVRKWFLSCILTARIRVHGDSSFVAYLPKIVRKRADDSGILITDPIPAHWFKCLGGLLVSISRNVYFRSHLDAIPVSVTDIRETTSGDVMLCLSDQIVRRTTSEITAYHWSLDGLTIGE